MLRDQIQSWREGKRYESKFEDLIKSNKVENFYDWGAKF